MKKRPIALGELRRFVERTGIPVDDVEALVGEGGAGEAHALLEALEVEGHELEAQRLEDPGELGRVFHSKCPRQFVLSNFNAGDLAGSTYGTPVIAAGKITPAHARTAPASIRTFAASDEPAAPPSPK